MFWSDPFCMVYFTSNNSEDQIPLFNAKIQFAIRYGRWPHKSFTHQETTLKQILECWGKTLYTHPHPSPSTPDYWHESISQQRRVLQTILDSTVSSCIVHSTVHCTQNLHTGIYSFLLWLNGCKVWPQITTRHQLQHNKYLHSKTKQQNTVLIIGIMYYHYQYVPFRILHTRTAKFQKIIRDCTNGRCDPRSPAQCHSIQNALLHSRSNSCVDAVVDRIATFTLKQLRWCSCRPHRYIHAQTAALMQL